MEKVPGRKERARRAEIAFVATLAPATRASLTIARRATLPRFDEAPTEPARDTDDLYEYLVGHEAYFTDGRRFHICVAHRRARAALARGLAPDFVCPLGAAACPMRAIADAAAGAAVLFSIGTTESA